MNDSLRRNIVDYAIQLADSKVLESRNDDGPAYAYTIGLQHGSPLGANEAMAIFWTAYDGRLSLHD